ncbi:transcription activator acu-15 [Fusarium mundagurra]|uniref:Transcription activator acu-15 n=1 Tax=Fusarium mundagurra TaxID=1567541 RepID=A0A8H6D6S8_9HYPO|nr:transcription activator acu-15 [Fusarium mundagurra]
MSLRVSQSLRRAALRPNPSLLRTPIIAHRFQSTQQNKDLPILYSAHAKVVGARKGHVEAESLNVDLTMSKALGGPGDAGKTNPEEMFAAGYGACFQSAMNAVAAKDGITMPTAPEDSIVETTVHLVGDMKKLDMGLRVDMKISVRGLEKEQIEGIVEKTKKVCPYSRAIEGNVLTESQDLLVVALEVSSPAVGARPANSAATMSSQRAQIASAGEKCSYGAKQAYPAEYVKSLERQISRLQDEIASPRRNVVSPTSQQQTLSMVDAQSENERSNLTETATSDLEASVRVDTGQQVQGGRISDGSDLLSKEVGDKLIEAYYARVHPKHPFLPRKRVQSLHDARIELFPAHKTEGRTSKCDYATLQLVYAIGARYLQLSNDDDHYSSPKQHYACAMADADSIFVTGSLESLEAMLLLTIYQLRSPTGHGVWWMIETTMRYCIDNGLHRQATNLAPTLDERRKRIFWTAYMLEISVARTMGRPHSISDRDIDVALPANIDDELDTDGAILAAIAESNQHPSQITALTPAIHIFRLQQIDSKISYTVCRVDKDVSEIKPHKVTRLRQALEEWKAGIPQTDPENKPHPYLTTDYHMIQYHKAIILLNLPFLPTLTPQSPTFQEIVHSAGQVCSLSKRLHDQQTYISFSLLSLHANFVAGLVMVYCFCLDSSIFSPKFSSSVRACSTMLYIISERWPRAVQARNAFDRLVAATIESDHESNNGILRSEDDLHVSQDGFGADEPGQLEVWNSFESILGDHQIDLGTWMHDSIFDTMGTFQPMDWTE